MSICDLIIFSKFIFSGPSESQIFIMPSITEMRFPGGLPQNVNIRGHMNQKSIEMPKSSKKSEGFHSAAGLIRYFEAEEDVALKINPWMVVGLCVGLSVLVLIMDILFPT